MKLKRTTLALAVVLLGAIASGSALAHHGGRQHHQRSHAHFGVFVGAPAFWYYPRPYYYPPPHYYYPPVAVAPAAPPVYIERGNANTPPEQTQGYWYYCPGAQAYYPYVKQCGGGWQRVAPQPPQG